MRRIALMSLVVVLVSMGGTPIARADTPGCVSRREYNRVTKGMTMTKVHNIFDTEGQLTGLGAPNELRYYETCTGRGVIQLIFSPADRMVSKNGRFF
jgi:hypothetical protein